MNVVVHYHLMTLHKLQMGYWQKMWKDMPEFENCKYMKLELVMVEKDKSTSLVSTRDYRLIHITEVSGLKLLIMSITR